MRVTRSRGGCPYRPLHFLPLGRNRLSLLLLPPRSDVGPRRFPCAARDSIEAGELRARGRSRAREPPPRIHRGPRWTPNPRTTEPVESTEPAAGGTPTGFRRRRLLEGVELASKHAEHAKSVGSSSRYPPGENPSPSAPSQPCEWRGSGPESEFPAPKSRNMVDCEVRKERLAQRSINDLFHVIGRVNEVYTPPCGPPHCCPYGAASVAHARWEGGSHPRAFVRRGTHLHAPLPQGTFGVVFKACYPKDQPRCAPPSKHPCSPVSRRNPTPCQIFLIRIFARSAPLGGRCGVCEGGNRAVPSAVRLRARGRGGGAPSGSGGLLQLSDARR
jgi:hypothetical protein